MKHILLPTDLLPGADAVWKYMLPLLKITGADIHFVHAVDDLFVKEERDHIGAEGVDKITSDLIYKMRSDAEIGMARLKERVYENLAAEGMHNQVNGTVHNGAVEEVILRIAAEIQPQLIVMGSHDHRKLDRLFFGSVPQSILKHAGYPVLILPEKYSFKPIREVLYMSNLDDEDVYSAGKLINLFSDLPFKLHITHFNLDSENKDADLYTIADTVRTNYHDIPVEFEVIDARILRDAYRQYISRKQIDLIAVTNRKEKGINKFLHQSTAVDVMYNSKIPVLVFHKS